MSGTPTPRNCMYWKAQLNNFLLTKMFELLCAWATGTLVTTGLSTPGRVVVVND